MNEIMPRQPLFGAPRKRLDRSPGHGSPGQTDDGDASNARHPALTRASVPLARTVKPPHAA